MIYNATVEQIRSWPVKDGWSKSPSGDRVKLGNDVKLGNGVTLGNDVTLGDWVTLGNGVKLGNDVKLGDGVKLGNGIWPCTYSAQGTRHSISIYSSDGSLAIGCEIHPLAWWRKHHKAVGRVNGYTPAQVQEYRGLIEAAAAWWRVNGKAIKAANRKPKAAK